MNTLIRALLDRLRGDGPGKHPYRYKPDLSDAALATTMRIIDGDLLRQASDHYHSATMGWMMPAATYERIPLRPGGAEVRLISYDGGSCRRADGQDWGGDGPDWLLEDIYTIQVRLWVRPSTRDSYGSRMIMPVMASDWDSWLPAPATTTGLVPTCRPTITSSGTDRDGRKMTW